MSVPVLLVLLSLAILMPLVGFTVFSLDRFSKNFHQLEADALRNRVAGLSATIEREVTGLINVGRALASSPSLKNGDMAAFHNEARQTVRAGELNVLLLAPDMQQLVNTRVTFGTVLPKTSAPEVAQLAMSSGKPVVSDIFYGAISKRRVFNVALPVVLDGETRYVLFVTAEPVLIEALLAQQHLREGYVAAVRDRAGDTFASSSKEPSPTFSNVTLPSSLSSGTAINLDVGGENSLLAYEKSQLTGWTTVMWVPMRVIDAPLDSMWNTIIRAGLFALATSIMLSYFFSRPIAYLIRHINHVLPFVGRGAALPAFNTILSEGREIFANMAQTDDDLRKSQQKNRVGKALLDTLLDTVPTAITVISFPELEIIAESEVARSLMGHGEDNVLREGLEKGRFSNVFLPDGVTPLEWKTSAVFVAAHENRVISGEHYIVARPDGQRLQIEVSVSPFHNEIGEVIGTVACWRDVTEGMKTLQRLADNDQHLRLVLRELTHRAKNLLAVIMSIASQTARRNASLDDFLAVFSKRVQGLGASHDLLVKSDWRGVELTALIVAQLSPFGGVDGERIALDGQNILLRPDVLQALGLAVHELATNAAKYGALTVREGRISISWRKTERDGVPTFEISWVESQGPPVKPATHKGFGHVIMVKSLAAAVNGQVELDFKETGLVWQVVAPWDSVTEAEE